MKPRILVIIPAYNAARYLVELVSRVGQYFPAEDIVIINDGSHDDTEDILDSLACRCLSFAANQGKGAALKAGFQIAIDEKYDAAVTIDADLQHPPENLPDFVRYYDRADVLIGTRNIKLRLMPWERQLTNNLTSIIISVFGTQRVRDSQSGYRMLKLNVIRDMRLKSQRYDTESELLFQSGYLGYTVSEVPIETVYEGSRSFINPLKDTLRFIRQIWRRLWY